MKRVGCFVTTIIFLGLVWYRADQKSSNTGEVEAGFLEGGEVAGAAPAVGPRRSVIVQGSDLEVLAPAR